MDFAVKVMSMDSTNQPPQKVEQIAEADTSIQTGKTTPESAGKNSNRKRKLIIALITVGLIVAAGLAGYFLIWHKSAGSSQSQAAGNQKVQNNTKNSSSFYLTQFETNSSKAKLVLVDPVTREQRTLFTADSTDSGGDNSSSRLVAIKNVDGVYRKFLDLSKTVNGKITQSIAYQDGDEQPKTLYEVSLVNGSDDYVFLYTAEDSISENADSIAFYEYNNGGAAQKRVDLNGNVTVLASQDVKGAEWLKDFDPPLTPGAISADGKTMYLHAHSCLQCDGPSLAHVVALDLSTKKMSMLFSEPDSIPGGWSKLNSNSIIITASEWPGLGGPGSYEENINYRQRIYILDLKTGTAKKVFESKSAESMSMIGSSSDGSKAYVQITAIVKDTKIIDDIYGSPGGHEWHYESKEIRAYDTATGEYEIVSLPENVSQQDMQFLNSKGDIYVYAVKKRYQPFAEYTEEPTTIFTYRQGDKEPLELIKSDGYTNFMGFEQE